MPPDTLSVKFGTPIGVASAGACHWAYSESTDLWQVDLVGEFGTVSGHGSDAFEALQAARAYIEPDGWRVGLTGCRIDAWPSGMARDMGQGLRVYILSRHERPRTEDLVNTFSVADLSLVGDVATQVRTVQELSQALM